MSTAATIEERPLGETSGLTVPAVGMGTWRTLDVRGAGAERRAHEIVGEALDAGARFVDSSPMYGEAERVLGGGWGGRRAEAIVATKVWTSDDDEAEAQVRRALRWYGGRVDLYQVHNLVSWPERLTMLERECDRGAVVAIGATHYSPSAFGELARVMRTGRISAIQIPYNPHERGVEREILPLAEQLGIGVVVMRPVGGGGGIVTRPPDDAQLETLRREYGLRTWGQALLKWVLSDRRCHVAIPATSRPERVRENAAAGAPPWFDDEARALVAPLAAPPRGGRPRV